MAIQEDVSFKTLDGLVLRGWLFPASTKGPGIVMTPGLNFPIGELYHEVALRFQEAGITVLVYDPRCVGLSDGMPRCDINPVKQSEDFSDAITFLKSKPTVDPNRIALWGYSLSGAEVLTAAGLDRRVKLVVVVCPAPRPYDMETPAKRKRYMDLAIRDRESQARGREPFYLQFIGDSEEAALFDYRKQQGMEELDYDSVMESLSKLPNFNNKVTVQTLSRIAAWPFEGVPKNVGATPVLQVYAGKEEYEHIRRAQDAIWVELTGPKERHYEQESGHMDILNSDGHRFEKLMKVQVDFVLKYFS
ncbi:Alpha/Beta hydrolase protein [Whalleya microplaca]|nr:Alpha/Beta hydrolase protein [Whalleya microplaca]